jgi:hypothetical protein
VNIPHPRWVEIATVVESTNAEKTLSSILPRNRIVIDTATKRIHSSSFDSLDACKKLDHVSDQNSGEK